MASFTTNAPVRGTTAPRYAGGLPPRDAEPDSLEARLRRGRLGMIVAMIGIVMIFISFSSAYVVRKGLPSFDPRTNGLIHDWLRVPLPALFLVNTCVLLVSSITMELARRQAARQVAVASVTPNGSDFSAGSAGAGRVSWLTITIVLGLSFLAGQWMAWRELGQIGFYVDTSPSSSFVYLLTATHGVHLLGGVLALIVAGAASLMRRAASSQFVLLDVTGWYWHFMAVLWLYIYCLLEFAH